MDTTGYEVSKLVVVDVILQPSFFKSRLKELGGRLTGDTKDYYGALFGEAVEKAQEAFAKELESGRLDGVTQLQINPFIQEIRGDVFVGAVAQGLGLIKKGEDR